MKLSKLKNAVLFFCFLFACANPKMEDVLAKVGSDSITVRDLIQALQREKYKFGDDYQKNSKKFLKIKQEVLEDLIQKKILETEAQKEGVVLSDAELEQEIQKYKAHYSELEFQKMLESRGIDYNAWREVKRVNLLTDKLVRGKIFSDIEIPEDQIRDYYNAHREEFTRPEMVRVRQILTDSKEKVEALYERLKEGENFARLAHNYSLSPDRYQGGDVGFIAKGKFPKEFDICFDLKVGELSPIISSLYGFHIFKVTEKKPEELVPYEQVKEQIKSWLIDLAREKAFEKYYGELRKKYPVEVKEWLLKKVKI